MCDRTNRRGDDCGEEKNPFNRTCDMVGLTLPESDLIGALRDRVIPPSCFEDPEFIADWLDPDCGGGTLESLAREKALYLAAWEELIDDMKGVFGFHQEERI